MMDNPSGTNPIPAPPVVGGGKPDHRVWLIAALSILLGTGALIGIRGFLRPPPSQPGIVAHSPTPTPTPMRIPSAVATHSAFRALEQAYASLSAGLDATNLDDPSLTPPVLDLPLGFRP